MTLATSFSSPMNLANGVVTLKKVSTKKYERDLEVLGSTDVESDSLRPGCEPLSSCLAILAG
jgi:hypothetical protein